MAKQPADPWNDGIRAFLEFTKDVPAPKSKPIEDREPADMEDAYARRHGQGEYRRHLGDY